MVLVERNVDTWYKSFDEAVLNSLWGRTADFMVGILEPLLGSRAGVANRKMVTGFFGVDDPGSIRKNAKEVYTQHYQRIRSIVPKERLLGEVVGLQVS